MMPIIFENSTHQCVLQHFSKYLGETRYIAQYEIKKNRNIYLASYDNIFGSCRAFCTLGLSDYPRCTGEGNEIFMPVNDGWDVTPSIIAGSISYIMQSSMEMGWGMSIRFSDIFPDFAGKYHKSAIYFSTPFGVPEKFHKASCDLKQVTILLGVYITGDEYVFFTKKGAIELESLLQQSRVDVFNISRQSCI